MTAPKKTAPKKTVAVKRAETEAAIDPDAYSFKGADGKTYRLPKPSDTAALDVPAGITEDALMYPDDQGKQLALGLHLLNLSGISEKDKAAFRALSTRRMLEVVQGWLGKLSGSSD